ncbi:hypothetical protein AVEN_127966-1 [Araneus ventricosus]|uniref:Uncharacterized protein n=1 Tax=Araneus ventricosus TaxID=182803 RepID=A0A4Y2A113_ARAVE|nr:hypothetical protein AVEN_127966-1 [Araneus ventricosus]
MIPFPKFSSRLTEKLFFETIFETEHLQFGNNLSADTGKAQKELRSTDPHSKLKEEVIARCGESKSQEIRLLAGEQLGDRKPSELFRVMQRRSESHNVADSLLLQLPPNMQSVLASIEPLTAEKFSELAERILEVTPVQVSSVSKSSSGRF